MGSSSCQFCYDLGCTSSSSPKQLWMGKMKTIKWLYEHEFQFMEWLEDIPKNVTGDRRPWAFFVRFTKWNKEHEKDPYCIPQHILQDVFFKMRKKLNTPYWVNEKSQFKDNKTIVKWPFDCVDFQNKSLKGVIWLVYLDEPELYWDDLDRVVSLYDSEPVIASGLRSIKVSCLNEDLMEFYERAGMFKETKSLSIKMQDAGFRVERVSEAEPKNIWIRTQGLNMHFITLDESAEIPEGYFPLKPFTYEP